MQWISSTKDLDLGQTDGHKLQCTQPPASLMPSDLVFRDLGEQLHHTAQAEIMRGLQFACSHLFHGYP